MLSFSLIVVITYKLNCPPWKRAAQLSCGQFSASDLSMARDGMALRGDWVGSGTEVYAMSGTEGTEAGLEATVLVLAMADSWTHDLKCGQQSSDYN